MENSDYNGIKRRQIHEFSNFPLRLKNSLKGRNRPEGAVENKEISTFFQYILQTKILRVSCIKTIDVKFYIYCREWLTGSRRSISPWRSMKPRCDHVLQVNSLRPEERRRRENCRLKLNPSSPRKFPIKFSNGDLKSNSRALLQFRIIAVVIISALETLH